MKKALIIVLMVTLLAMCAFGVSALKVDSVTIGNSRQDRVDDVSATFKVTNNGTTNLTGISLSTTADSKYNIRFNPSTFNLTAGQAQTVTVKGDIPLSHPAVETDSSKSNYLEEAAIKIGDITASAGTVSATAGLKMQADNKLEIKKITLYCGGTSDKLSDGETVDDLKPDTENCYLEVIVENKFRENDINDQHIGDVEFDAIEVEMEVDDDDLSIFETSSIDNLGADEEDEADTDDLEFDIDEDVPDGTYDMIIRVYGYDENNEYSVDSTSGFHGEIWEIELDVVRENYDIQIRSPQMRPAKLDCNGGIIKIDANLINLGKKDDDEVAAEIDIPDLNINKRRTGIDLDESDSTGISMSVRIPENVSEGVYPVNLNTYFKNTALSNTEQFELAIEACPVEEPEETEVVVDDSEDTTPNTVTPTTPVDTTPDGAVPAAPRARVRTDDSEFQESNAYLWLLGILIVLFAAIVVVLLIVFFVRKPAAGRKK